MAILAWLSLLSAMAFLRIAMSSFTPTMAPAFIWSNNRFLGIEEHSVDYEIFTPKSLAKNLLERLHPSGKQETKRETNLFLAFIGDELRSVDIARDTLQKINTQHVLQNTMATSNFSVVLPHIVFSAEEDSFVDSLVDTIEQTENHGNILGELHTFGCTGANKALKEFGSIQDIEEFLSSRKVTNGGEINVLVICSPSWKLPLKEESEGKLLGKITQALSASVNDYVALYVSDLSKRSEYDLNLHVRQLSSSAGATNETFCDEICQTKATLLEALLVGVVLIFILVMGICCMAGVQSPSRFESQKES
ncbi:hypothetical protein O6H91_11G115700 [Diphasiastrum complanatum]|uniref:Uncharacterized protein n=1 Tax=Diphasiastrum complanatum TaxID=34168 RepID=A0ACC2CDD5_DIPCM|nr:hypothetical protein O6H91_11G115700 [Diphasiastrum complanatum]